ncbi:MAG TPA: alpha/beta hydrolase [Polyangiaceae bacterium]|jgi:pimeloyl-ACP methyl ester carboxylesterase|nr:alpha/beta hydrolase [Polyangiaceae bacterium]
MVDTVTSRDGTRIAYEAKGAGAPLVMAGGAMQERATTGIVRPLLEPHFTVVTYDRRGRADSGDTPPYAPDREVEDIAALLDMVLQTRGRPAFLYGHSSGAILSLRAAMRGLPMAKLVVYEPPFIIPGTRPAPPADALARIEAAVASGDREGAIALFLGEQVGLPPEVVTQMKTLPMWGRLLKLAHTVAYDTQIAANHDVPAAALAAVTVPTLVLRGSASFPWIHETAAAVARALPHAELVTLEGQTHNPAPDVLCPPVIRFLEA